MPGLGQPGQDQRPANRHKAVGFTREQFHYAFTTTLSREESDKVYQHYHIPAPGSFWIAIEIWDQRPRRLCGHVRYARGQ